MTEQQQDRYSRHLLLPGFGGEGQERLLAACVRVRGAGQGALWAARYLAASGVGWLILDGEVAAACAGLNPDVRVRSGDAVRDQGGEELHAQARGEPFAQDSGELRALSAGEARVADLVIELENAGPLEGARAALDAVARLCGARE